MNRIRDARRAAGMIILYKTADYAHGRIESRQIGRLAGNDLLTGVVIDQQNPVKQSMFLH